MYDTITLPNGLRIIGERMPHYRSVAIGLWVLSGSLYETAEENGVSHFIEHMLFEGTSTRSARRIAEEMDAVGGSMNAFTSKECTCFYAKVVDDDLPLAMDIIADIVRNSVFSEECIAKEKGVVLEEIGMAEDQPEDLVGELIMSARLGDQALARPILGTADTLNSLSREHTVGYYKRMYRPENCVLAVAGNYDLEQLRDLAEKAYGSWQGSGEPAPSCPTAMPKGRILRRQKDIEQIHISLAWPGVPQADPRSYPLVIFNTVFGSANSSRLFQRIREESGLAYSVYSYFSAFPDTGIECVYAGASRENAEEVLAMTKEECEKLRVHGLTEEEFLPAKRQLRAGFLLGLESTSGRMQSLGRRKLLLGNAQSAEEVLAKLDAITLDQVNAVAAEVLSSDCAVALVGDGADDLDVSMFCK